MHEVSNFYNISWMSRILRELTLLLNVTTIVTDRPCLRRHIAEQLQTLISLSGFQSI